MIHQQDDTQFALVRQGRVRSCRIVGCHCGRRGAACLIVVLIYIRLRQVSHSWIVGTLAGDLPKTTYLSCCHAL
jgi:hypothetical protein